MSASQNQPFVHISIMRVFSARRPPATTEGKRRQPTLINVSDL
jgi:hypothetical protein